MADQGFDLPGTSSSATMHDRNAVAALGSYDSEDEHPRRSYDKHNKQSRNFKKNLDHRSSSVSPPTHRHKYRRHERSPTLARRSRRRSLSPHYRDKRRSRSPSYDYGRHDRYGDRRARSASGSRYRSYSPADDYRSGGRRTPDRYEQKNSHCRYDDENQHGRRSQTPPPAYYDYRDKHRNDFECPPRGESNLARRGDDDYYYYYYYSHDNGSRSRRNEYHYGEKTGNRSRSRNVGRNHDYNRYNDNSSGRNCDGGGGGYRDTYQQHHSHELSPTHFTRKPNMNSKQYGGKPQRGGGGRSNNNNDNDNPNLVPIATHKRRNVGHQDYHYSDDETIKNEVRFRGAVAAAAAAATVTAGHHRHSSSGRGGYGGVRRGGGRRRGGYGDGGSGPFMGRHAVRR